MQIIPAIDIIDGKCVRLTQGDYQKKKVYNEDPLEVAKSFEAAGIQRLHVVDLDGAKARQIINYKTLERLASDTNLVIDFGGGLQSEEDVRIAFNAGAQQVTGGTIAVKNPALFLSWLNHYGTEKIILGADTKNGRIAVSGWQEESNAELLPFLADYTQKGIQYVICTEISKDGMLEGSAQELYSEILQELPQLKLIASGGVSSIADLKSLQQIGCYGAIIGKAIYEGKIKLEELAQFINP